MATREHKTTPALIDEPDAPDADLPAPVRYGLHGNGITGIEYVTRATPSEKLAITFSAYGQTDLQAPGFAEDFLIARGYDLLVVKCSLNNWYQDMSAATMKSVVDQLPPYPDIITYGSNMGGYGALYFAETVGARTCIVMSPQFAIDRTLVPFETRWSADAARVKTQHQPLDQILARSRATIYMVYDPHTPDRHHAEMIQTTGRRVYPVPVPYVGHPAEVALDEMGLLGDLFDRLVSGSPRAAASIIRKRRRRRTKSPSYLNALAQLCLRKHRLETAESLLTQACRMTNRADIHLGYSQILLQRNKPQKALEVLDGVWPRLHTDMHLIAYRAHLLRMNGKTDEALQSFDTAIAEQPDVLAFYQGERGILRDMMHSYKNEKRLNDAALARARAELQMHQGPKGTISRPMMIVLGLIPLVILIFVGIVAISFRLV